MLRAIVPVVAFVCLLSERALLTAAGAAGVLRAHAPPEGARMVPCLCARPDAAELEVLPVQSDHLGHVPLLCEFRQHLLRGSIHSLSVGVACAELLPSRVPIE